MAAGLEATCPLCDEPVAGALRTLDFRRGKTLPNRISLHACRHCDFVFTWPRDRDAYETFYGAVANDFINSVSNFKNQEQLARLSRLIDRRGLTRVMDFGCGQGGLLSALAARHPDVQFVGYDVNGGFPPGAGNLSFTQVQPASGVDLVILSHVLEHAPDPIGMIKDIRSTLDPRHLYVETPYAEGYRETPQPQYLYYIDRLHINHFGLRSLTKALGNRYRVREYGVYEMPYDLGPLYPCQYALFAAVRDGQSDVKGAITGYIDDQAEAFAAIRAHLKTRSFYVYGFGDNFFRSRSPGGPLAGLEARILGVIDRDIEAFKDLLPQGCKPVHPDAMAMVNGALIVCAVTQSGSLGAFMKTACPDSEILYL